MIVGVGDAAGLGVAGAGATEGDGNASGVAVGNASGVGVGVAEGVGVGVAVLLGSLSRVGVLRGADSVLALAVVMSRPALSMASHAVADTPATATSQIAAMPTAERGLITMSSLCHLGDPTPQRRAKPPYGVACSLWPQSC